jgi:putative oxidoreductase
MKQSKQGSLESIVLSLMRMVLGLTFSMHGVQKLLGFFGGKVVAYWSLMGLAGALELFGGLLLLAGLFTRPVAFVLSGMMAVAYFMAHAHRSFWPIENGGELAVVYCFSFLYLSMSGAGRISLDRILRKV